MSNFTKLNRANMKGLKSGEKIQENGIIYTQSKEILTHIEDIYAYHLCRDYRVLGFDDYDEMEEMLLDNDCWKHSQQEIKQEFMNDLFNEQTYQQKYGKIDIIFRK